MIFHSYVSLPEGNQTCQTIHPTSFNSLKPMARRSFHRLLGFVAAFRDDVVRDLTAEEFPAVGHGQEEEDGGSGKAQGPDGNGQIHGKSEMGNLGFLSVFSWWENLGKAGCFWLMGIQLSPWREILVIPVPGPDPSVVLMEKNWEMVTPKPAAKKTCRDKAKEPPMKPAKKNSHPGVDGMLIKKPKLGTCLKIPDSIYFKIIHNDIIYIYILFSLWKSLAVIGPNHSISVTKKTNGTSCFCSSQKLIFLPYCRAQISATNQVLSKISATPTTQKERTTTSLDHPKKTSMAMEIQHPTYLWIHMLLIAYTHTHL